MAEKKKKKKAAPAPSTFNAGSFRRGEEASMAGFPAPKATIVDERTQLQAKGVVPKPVKQEPPAEVKPKLYFNYYTGEYVTDPSLIKPRTGMGGAESGGGVIQVTGTEADEGDSDEGDGDPNTLTAAEVKKMMEDFYAQIQADAAAQKREAAQSAYSLLYEEFNRYGLGALVTPLQKYIQDGISAAEFTIRLRNEPAYKKRFAANEGRIQKGLRALSEAEYIGLEDQYQDIMRRYGMPETYYRQEKDPVTGITLQPGFEKLIAGDVSAVELEDRVQTAYDRVINANPQITQTLREFYPEISNGDILAYALDPQNAINNIKRKVTATEIGAAAAGEQLGTSRTRAEQLGALGVTGQQYRQAAPTIKEAATIGTRLSNIYGDEKYGQLEAEAELLDIAGAGEAAARRKKLTGLETSQFSKASGLARGALGGSSRGAI